MATLRLLMFLMLAALFQVCSPAKSKLIILFDHFDFIETGSQLLLNDESIGTVTHIDTFNKGVAAMITMTKNVRIPSESKFFLNTPFIGSAFITVELSDKTTFLKSKDTIIGQYIANKISRDTTSEKSK